MSSSCSFNVSECKCCRTKSPPPRSTLNQRRHLLQVLEPAPTNQVTVAPRSFEIAAYRCPNPWSRQVRASYGSFQVSDVQVCHVETEKTLESLSMLHRHHPKCRAKQKQIRKMKALTMIRTRMGGLHSIQICLAVSICKHDILTIFTGGFPYGSSGENPPLSPA